MKLCKREYWTPPPQRPHHPSRPNDEANDDDGDDNKPRVSNE